MKFKKTEVGTIPESWNVVTIDSLKNDKKNAIAMGPFGSNIKSDNFTNYGVPVIRGNNLKPYYMNESNFVYLTPEKAATLHSSKVVRGDIVIMHRGTLGTVGYIGANSLYEEYIISQSGLKITLDKTRVNSKYVYYFLNSRQEQHQLLLNASQVGVPAIAQATKAIKQIHVPFPELSIQNKIVELIDTLQNKIEVNKRINDNLAA